MGRVLEALLAPTSQAAAQAGHVTPTLQRECEVVQSESAVMYSPESGISWYSVCRVWLCLE